MSVVKLLSAGAAEGLAHAVAEHLKARSINVEGTFGPVGSIRAQVEIASAADVVILPPALIAELAREGRVLAASAVDLGVVEAAIAVREVGWTPPIRDQADLLALLRDADAIYVPDTNQSTAGAHFAAVLDRLGIRSEVWEKLRVFRSGALAMGELAEAGTFRAIGCTQGTEILNTPGLRLLGGLPEGFDLRTTYTAAVLTDAADPGGATALVAALGGDSAKAMRLRSGFKPA
jgi:molybdate transport system substrate-binding protein